MDAAIRKAEVLIEALSYIRSFRNRLTVIKLGGSAMEDAAALRATLQDVLFMETVGLRPVLVHGGGKPIDRAMAAAGLHPRKVLGRRYTDDATLDIVVRVLKDEINPGIVDQLNQLGGNAVSAASLLRGERLTLSGPDGSAVDLGRVGTVTRVDTDRLRDLIARGTVPVIPSLALDAAGRWLNVNADTAASAVAGALVADKVVFLTDTPGVLRDRADTGSLFPRLTEAECRGLIGSGVIDGGMVPKVEACFEALAAGARSVAILDGRVPYSLLDVFLKDTFAGTEIAR